MILEETKLGVLNSNMQVNTMLQLKILTRKAVFGQKFVLKGKILVGLTPLIFA